MNYQEAIKHSLKVEWKIGTCSQGKDCWCRTVGPKIRIEDDNGDEVYIAASGALFKEHAEHIVKIHNENIKNNEQ